MMNGQCVAIIGTAGSGKTTLIQHYIQPVGSSSIIQFAEPEAENHSDAFFWNALATSLFGEAAVYEARGSELGKVTSLETSGPDVVADAGVIIVDSLRKFVYKATGSLGSGGVSNEVFMLLTTLSAVARATGKLIMVVINPLVTNQQAMGDFIERAMGSVDTVIHVRRETHRIQLDITSRQGANRDWVTLGLPTPTETSTQLHSVEPPVLELDNTYDINSEPVSTAWMRLAARR